MSLIERLNAAWEEQHGMNTVVDGFEAVEFARQILYAEAEMILRSGETDSARIAQLIQLSEEAR
jgi:uncharacterized protein YgiM (DUF1202 family)